MHCQGVVVRKPSESIRGLFLCEDREDYDYPKDKECWEFEMARCEPVIDHHRNLPQFEEKRRFRFDMIVYLYEFRIGSRITVEEAIVTVTEKDGEVITTEEITEDRAEAVFVYDLVCFLIYAYFLVDFLYSCEWSEFEYVIEVCSETSERYIYILPRLGDEDNVTAIVTMEFKPLYQILRKSLKLPRIVLNTGLINDQERVRRNRPNTQPIKRKIFRKRRFKIRIVVVILLFHLRS